MPVHSGLTGADLHEPKGVASANAGEVYVADGAGSGAWSDLLGANTVIVESSSDLPTPSGGVITLSSNTVYRINGSVSIGSNRVVLADNCVITGIGSRDRDGITTTTTGVVFSATDVDFSLFNFNVTAVNASALWDIDGTGVEQMVIRNLEIIDTPTLGDIDNMRSVEIDNLRVIDLTTNGMTFTGAFTELQLKFWDVDTFAGTLMDLQTATFDEILIMGHTAVVPSGTTWLDVAASGANLNSGHQGFITTCSLDLTGGGTATTGYDTGDDEWEVFGNRGVVSSLRAAQGFALNNATATTFAGIGAGNDVAVDFSTNFTSGLAKSFTVSNAGRFTYNNTQTRNFFVDATIFGAIGGGAARTYNYYIAKNGTIIDSSVAQVEYDGTLSLENSCKSHVTLDTTDFVELYVRAETATTSLTVDTCSITISEV